MVSFIPVRDCLRDFDFGFFHGKSKNLTKSIEVFNKYTVATGENLPASVRIQLLSKVKYNQLSKSLT